MILALGSHSIWHLEIAFHNRIHIISKTSLPLLTLFTEKQLEDSKGDEDKHEMRPLVDKNQHQQNPSLQPRRPQIVVGDNKQLAPIDTCTTVAPSIAGAGVNFTPPSVGANANYENFAPSEAGAYANVAASAGTSANFAPSVGAGAHFLATSGANGQESKPNSANVIHCNFVLKRTNDPVHQI